MALLKPDIGQPAEVNAARIGTAFDLLNDHSNQIQELYSGVSQNTLAIASQGPAIAALQSWGVSAGLTLSSYGASITALNSSMAGVNSRLSAYGDNIGGLNDLTRTLLLRLDQAASDIQANAKTTADNLIAALAAAAAANQEAVSARQMALLAALQSGRPAITPLAYARDVSAPATGTTPLDPAGAVTTLLGPAYQFTAAAVVAPRISILWDPDRIWVVRARYWRLADVIDPNNNAIDFGIQWLDGADAEMGRSVLHREHDLQVLSGPQTLTFRVPSLAGATPAIQPPKGAISWRPYLRIYGSDGATALGELSVRDASFAGVYAPDVDGLTNRVSQAEGRITTIVSAFNADRRVISLAGDPTSTDLPEGVVRAVKNRATGRISLWINDDGHLVDLLIFTPVS